MALQSGTGKNWQILCASTTVSGRDASCLTLSKQTLDISVWAGPSKTQLREASISRGWFVLKILQQEELNCPLEITMSLNRLQNDPLVNNSDPDI